MAKLHKIETVAAVAKTMRVLAHPTRMKIIEFLADGEKHVGAIQKHTKLIQAVTSQHLKLLLVNGLV
ncbi:MAG: winged helix-turn-helix transcriptional regulator, partial [Candidatus Marinimicrobia bacterium]|nr:winged helix-turn-helix transcriptional regulator [Candidatus Neomarinimicrobiota bacterium]